MGSLCRGATTPLTRSSPPDRKISSPILSRSQVFIRIDDLIESPRSVHSFSTQAGKEKRKLSYEKFCNVNVIFVRVKGSHDGPSERLSFFICLPKINNPAFPIFPVAIMEQANLWPVD